MKITLLPVYSKLADAEQIRAVFSDRKLPLHPSLHQVETSQGLLDKDVDCVINTAMTGDGKSLAAYLPTLTLGDHRAFGMYPTIELSRDQERQFSSYTRHFGRMLRYESLWGTKLGERVARYPHFKRRSEALAELFSNHQVILTNPDIFSLIMNYRYESGLFTTQELPYSLATNFNTFVFDEFHIFSMPQIIAALTAMLFFRCYREGDSERPRFLFSSATTDATLLQMIRSSGLNVKEVSGNYTVDPTECHRQILHRTTLTIHQCQENEDAERWIERNLNIIVNHWRGASGLRPKGVIIVNSVASARRIVLSLKQKLAVHGMSVGENSGLVDETARKEAMRSSDIVVGTSTIDVGIDFNISFLLFETIDSGSFLQRLGRLGRVQQGEKPFSQYEAHALISCKTPWISAKLQEKFGDRGIQEGATIDRTTVLREVIGQSFAAPTNFQLYAKRWGSLQAAHVIAQLENNHPRDGHEGAYLRLALDLRKRYAAMLDLATLDKAMKGYWSIAPTKKKKREDPDSWEDCKAVCDEILGFRGSSPFQVGLWDATITPPAFLTYNALSLLPSTSYTLSNIRDFSLASGLSQQAVDEMLRYTMRGKDGKPVILKLNAFVAERERLRLSISGVRVQTITGQVCVLSQFSAVEPKSEALYEFNAALKVQQVVCYISRFDANKLRHQLRLPAMFPLYCLVDQHREYTVAFGKAALLLEAESLKLRNQDLDTTPIIC